MNLPCPSCRAPIVPGARHCTSCGTNLLREAAPDSVEPVCAVHPGLSSLEACSRCGSFACAQCLREGGQGEPLCAACEDREPSGLLPWDRREDMGTLKAFWQTCQAVMFRPEATFKRLRPGGTMGSSLTFAMLCSLASFLTTGILYSFVMGLIPSRTDGLGLSSPRAAAAGFFLGLTLLMPVFGLIATLVSSALDHLMLKLAGSEHSLEVTLRGNALSQAPMLLGLIPICGLYVAPLWAVGLRIFVYRSLHRTGWGTALLGALGMPLLTCCMCSGLSALGAS